MVNSCELRTYAYGTLVRSRRVFVGHERSHRTMTVLITLETITELQGFATILFIGKTVLVQSALKLLQCDQALKKAIRVENNQNKWSNSF